MRKLSLSKALLILAGLAVLAGAAYLAPPVQRRLSWRVDVAQTYLRAVLNPAGALPTSLPQPQVMITHQPTSTAQASEITTLAPTATLGPPPTATPQPTPIPKMVSIEPPKWEKQDANNCGPATLALLLRHYGWEGDQFTISELIKPYREDRNVNVEELVYYVRNRTGWLNIEYRVNGDLETLKRLLATGLPVMIEEGTLLDQSYWPNDDQWAAHYLLLTGYDDATRTFTGQDSYYGANKKIPYDKLDKAWQAFNRVYIMVYPPEKEAELKSVVGQDWDVEFNRRGALEKAHQESTADPTDAFAWFNLGTNLAYFERYAEAANAYNTARDIGLPQRMLRYQFGPFMAYFHSGQLTELETILDYALKITRNSEEAFLWRGWMKYRQGHRTEAVEDFRQALVENPNYADAKYALDFVTKNP